MPYYSVRIHGPDAGEIARDLKNTFRGRDIDYTGSPMFLVQRPRKTLEDVEREIGSLVELPHTCKIAQITRDEFYWQRRQRKR